ncbi:MAG: VWA domain-containing protein [Nitrospirae bacterium]|uniref:vWA domain-containing protein n=1 Tax=Candidatus Magnetobacterium casense TaxID=1455061 RepID=UPI00058BB45E|nr:VWA domain-containing protein [Candidatus Magnetobacterium casensis]MBF0338471.1 VWA domain-containing protein [Nitrospirota bacterium]
MSKLEDAIGIANPQHPHCATVLVLDTSGSMDGVNINQLNDGVRFFKEDVLADELASKRADIAIISFGAEIKVVHDFSSVTMLPDIVLDANGLTPMGDALLLAMDMVEQRKKEYKNTGVDYYRPWIFMITDGGPTDMNYGDSKWNNVVQRVHDGEKSGKFMFFAVGVDSADMQTLQAIASPTRPPLKLQQGKFRDMFSWLSKSVQAVSGSKPGQQVALAPPGWGSI